MKADLVPVQDTELVMTAEDGSLAVSHKVVALNTGNQEHTVTRVVRKFMDDFEEFGRVGFKIHTLETNGGLQKVKEYLLNEQQATLLLTYLKNSEVVRRFKVALVKEFYEMRTALYQKDYEGNVPSSETLPYRKINEWMRDRMLEQGREIEALKVSYEHSVRGYKMNLVKKTKLIESLRRGQALLPAPEIQAPKTHHMRLEELLAHAEKVCEEQKDEDIGIMKFYNQQTRQFSKMAKEYRAIAEENDLAPLFKMIDKAQEDRRKSDTKYYHLREKVIKMMAGLKDVDRFVKEFDGVELG